MYLKGESDCSLNTLGVFGVKPAIGGHRRAPPPRVRGGLEFAKRGLVSSDRIWNSNIRECDVRIHKCHEKYD